MTKLYIDIEDKPKVEEKTPLLNMLWQLDKKLVEGYHYIKLSDALQLVSQKKLDQKS